MKTAMRRWVMLFAVVAAPFAASAMSPAGNGVGDGEANVPFATVGGGAGEMGRVAPGQVRGRAGRPAGRRAYGEVRADAPVQTEADRAFAQSVWTAP